MQVTHTDRGFEWIDLQSTRASDRVFRRRRLSVVMTTRCHAPARHSSGSETRT